MTYVDWHPYPDEKPQKDGVYLVTMRVWDATYEDYFEGVGFFYFMNTDFLEDGIHEVIAWAEKPEPYKPEEPEDNHPDAITARKYAEGDPDTVKALHIFDE